MGEWKNGLPPVGEVCRMYLDKRDTEGEEVLMVGRGVCNWPVVQSTETAKIYEVNPKYHFFKPLKSEEERMRDEFASEMYLTLNEFDGISMRQSTAQNLLKHLYDAGLRKVNPLTDEQIHDYVEANYFYSTDLLQERVRKALTWARSQIMGEES